MSDRVIAPKWLENQNRWQVKLWIDGVRRTFTSATPGRKGREECARKARIACNGIADDSIRISALYALFLEDVKARTSTGNYTNLESLGRVWILPSIGSKQMRRLTEQDMQDILNSAGKKGRSRKHISNIRGALTSFLRFARKKGVTQLHADDLVIPNSAPVGERSILSKNDLEILFSVNTTTFNKKPCDEFYIHAFRFLVTVGLRPGELCELQRRNQGDCCAISVHGSFNRFSEHTHGKTRNAVRTFILPSLGTKILADQAQMLKEKRIISKYLFPDRDGDQLTSRELYKRLKRYEAVNGLTDVSLYELRHTFVSMCKGVIPEALIQPFVGHSSKMPTYNTYGHQMSDDMQTVAALIDSAYADITSNVEN